MSTRHPTVLGTRRPRSRRPRRTSVSAWSSTAVPCPMGRAGSWPRTGTCPALVVDLWGAPMVLGCRAPYWTWRTIPARWPASSPPSVGSDRGVDHAQAVDQPIRRPAYVDSGLQNSTFRESGNVRGWACAPSDYGSVSVTTAVLGGL